MEALQRQEKEGVEEDRRLEKERREVVIAETKAMWRRAARQTHIASIGRSGSVKVGIRFPDGRRVTGAFRPDDSVLSLYCLVDEHLHPTSPSSSELADATPVSLEDLMASHGLDADAWWGFKIFLSYPRKEISFGTSRTIGGDGIEGSVSVELISATSRGASEVGDYSDGYETEDE